MADFSRYYFEKYILMPMEYQTQEYVAEKPERAPQEYVAEKPERAPHYLEPKILTNFDTSPTYGGGKSIATPVIVEENSDLLRPKNISSVHRESNSNSVESRGWTPPEGPTGPYVHPEDPIQLLLIETVGRMASCYRKAVPPAVSQMQMLVDVETT